jgi:hypothetical protein
MRVRAALSLFVVLAACGGDESTQSVDGGNTDERLSGLKSAREAWLELEKQHDGTYWYEEQNCVALAGGAGETTLVQVEKGVVTASETSSTPATECHSGLDRYGGFTGQTFPELYDYCVSLLAEHPEVTPGYTVDEQGGLISCGFRESDCFDSCSVGFSIVRWAFGKP